MTILPVVSAYGRAWNSHIVLQGKRTKYCVMEDRSTINPGSYIPRNDYVIYREATGVDGAICFELAGRFIIEIYVL